MTTMIDLELTASHAAAYLAEQLHDDRDFGMLLADQRCGKRKNCILFHRGRAGRVLYYQSDLDAFVALESGGIRTVKPIRRVERVAGALGSTLPPSRVLAIV